MLIKFLLLFTVIPLSINFFAQTGPGGVGNNTGTSELKIWLRADDVNADNDFSNNPVVNSLVTQWRDYSGTNYHFSNTGTNRPTYRVSGGIPAIYFNAALATAQFLNCSTSGTYNSSSAFFACNGINSGNSNVFVDNGTTSLRFEQFSNAGVIGFTRYGIADYNSTLASPFGINSIISFHKAATATTMTAYSNAANNTFSVGSAATGIPIDRLGNNTNGVDEISGDFFEVIVYNNQINSAQLIIVNNYLSSKYNIAIPNNIYIQDLVANGNYRYDVAGIGRVDASNLHSDSQGTGIVRILNPSNLGNNEFLLWGHNNALAQATNTSDVPSPVMARFQRVWRVNEVNATGGVVDVGNITMQFDLSGLGAITTSDLRLLIDINNNGIFSDDAPIAGAVSLGGNIYAFNNVSQIANNLRFTIGTINSTATPLPIGLVFFHAQLSDNRKVDLTWQTSTEYNNDYFTIERSQDGINWSTLSISKGMGNSITTTDYSTIDQAPLNNISYYRLKQTDFNGKFNYHQTIAINNSQNKKDKITVSPNPANHYIQVIGEIQPFDLFEFYNSVGQNLTTSFTLLNSDKNIRTYDISILPKGIYYLHLQNGQPSIEILITD